MRAMILGLCAMVLLSGCMMPAKTKVTKDGFMARMKTTEAHRAVVEDYDVYRTDCRYDQLMKDKDEQYYCPADAAKDAYNSFVYRATHQASVAETYGPPLITGAAIIGGTALLMHGLQTQAVSPASTAFPDARISTFNTFGQAPVGFVR